MKRFRNVDIDALPRQGEPMVSERLTTFDSIICIA